MTIFNTTNLIKLVIIASSLIGTSVVVPAAVSSAAASLTLSNYLNPVTATWKRLSAQKQLIAYQAIKETPLPTFPPGLLSLIVSYLPKNERRFTITGTDICAKNKDKVLGKCPRPFLALRPLLNKTDLTQASLLIYWCSNILRHSSLSHGKSFLLKGNAQEALDSSLYSRSSIDEPESIAVTWFHGFQMKETNYFCDKETSSFLPPLDSGLSFDACITDFDPELDSGTTIAGRVYDREIDEMICALMYACSHHLTDEKYKALTAKAEEEAKRTVYFTV